MAIAYTLLGMDGEEGLGLTCQGASLLPLAAHIQLSLDTFTFSLEAPPEVRSSVFLAVPAVTEVFTVLNAVGVSQAPCQLTSELQSFPPGS